MTSLASPTAPDDDLDMTQGPERWPSGEIVGRIIPAKVKGPIRTLKWRLIGLLMAVYLLTPWLRWDRGPNAPDQAVLIDLSGRKAYFLWIELWPQDLYLLTGLLVLAALLLFLMTALFGRVWCGFACPQTVWTDLFRLVEEYIEGDRGQRLRMAADPNFPGRRRMLLRKHAAWLGIALLTGGAFSFYFIDVWTEIPALLTGTAPRSLYVTILILTVFTYLLAGHAREKVCTHMCPWPRFQSALLDRDSLIVTYEGWRGEQRGKMAKPLRPSLKELALTARATGPLDLLGPSGQEAESWGRAAAGSLQGEAGRGDCIDCNRCVAVCPMGIDIRSGLQLACIGCGLCVDACNDVMAKIKRPANLIRFDNEANQLALGQGKAPSPYRILRPRTLSYLGAIAAVGSLLLLGLAMRAPLQLTVEPIRQPLFTRLRDGAIRNAYVVRMVNKTRAESRFAISVEGLDQPVLSLPDGSRSDPGQPLTVGIGPGEVKDWKLFVAVPGASAGRGQTDIMLQIQEVVGRANSPRPGGASASADTVFWSPK